MRLLLTNDDGYDAPGLAALSEVAARFGDAITVAPLTPQSYMGHRVTTHSALHVQKTSERHYRVNGTPADCSRIGLSCLAPNAEWVLSGINQGANLGVDTYISGTVAAAREAALLGYKSAAVSQYVAKGRPVDWKLTAARAYDALNQLFAERLPEGWFWNLNLPHPPETAPAQCELVFCPMDFHPLDIQYREESGAYYYCGLYHSRERAPGSDVDLCFRGKATATAIPLDLSQLRLTP